MAISQLDEVLERLTRLPEKDRLDLIEEATNATNDLIWVPNPGPQTDAYFCDADELLYGGEAGGGKSDLVIGSALTSHKRSLVLRRTNKEASKMVERFVEIIGSRDGYNGQEDVWRYKDRIIDISGCQHEDDKQKHKGNPHDLIGFDELVDFSKTQYEFIIAWNRSTDPKQRCRVIATTNPPTRPEGMWVIERWAPWLDPKHPHPAIPGEIRWFTTIEGKDTEVEGPGPHIVDGKPVMAKSRTFIRARLKDNPDLARTDYDARLAALPDELRLAYREGKFDTALKDAPFQCIPTDWIRAAQKRWSERAPLGVPMCSIGVDASGGGSDPMILAPRYDGWYPPVIEVLAKDIPTDRIGKVSVGHIVSHRRDKAVVVIDMGGGYGGPILEHCRDNDIECVPFKGAEESVRRTSDKQLKFTNKRTEAYWRFREALDPSQPGGSPISLPDDPRLMAELAAPTFEVTPNGIKLEPKDKILDRLGHSPDRADATVMAWFGGPTYLTDGKAWREKRMGRMPEVVMSKQASRHHIGARR